MAIGNPVSTTSSSVASKTSSVIATAGQTLFTVPAGYVTNHISVFRNGIRLVDGRDYEARNGATVTLLAAATVGDVLEFHVFDTFSVADAVTNQGGTIFGDLTVEGSIGDITANNVTGVAATFTGAVSVGGVLTYEDVTNIDSVGIITARSDLSIADKIIHTGDTNTSIRFPAADTITVETGGSERIRINSSGNVNFGANKSVAFPSGSGIQVYNSSAPRIKLVNDTTGVTSGDGSYLYVSGNDFLIENKESANMRFYTSATERLRIDSSGRLLVNTSTSRIVEDHVGNGPQGKIQIEATNSDAIMSIISAGTADSNRCGTISLGRHRNSTVGGTPTIVQNGDALGAIVFAAGDGTDMRTSGAKIHAIVDGTPGSNDMPGALIFSTTPDGSSSPYSGERMRIDSSGRLLVGTSNNFDASANLQAQGEGIAIKRDTNSNAVNNGLIRFYSGSGLTAQIFGLNNGVQASGDTPGALVFGTTASGASSPTERMRIDSSGRLLINHTADTAPAGYASKLQLCDTSYQGSSLLIRRDENSASAPALLFTKTRSSTKGGNTIVQNGDLTGQILFFAGDGNDAGALTAYIASAVDGTPGNNDMPGRLTFHTTADGATASTERMRIDSSGKFGFNTTNPGAFDSGANNFVVSRNNSGTGHAGITIASGNDSYGNLYFGDGTGAASYRGFIAYNHSEDSLRFGTVGTERMRIDSSGRMGIGTQTPTRTLTVQGDMNLASGSNIESDSSSGTLRIQGGSTYPGGAILMGGGTGTNDIRFSTTGGSTSLSATERMRITNGGLLKATTSTQTSRYTNGINHAIINDTNSNWILAFNHTAASPYGITIEFTGATPNSTSNHFLDCIDASALRFQIRSNGGIANYSANNVNLSDRNVKKDIAPATGTWDCLKEWEIVNFRYKDQADDADLNLGVIAQQVAESCPEVITVFQEATEDKPEKLGVKDQQMMWMAIKALQEAQTRIETLETQNADLLARVTTLEG